MTHTERVLEWDVIKEKLKGLSMSPLGVMEVDNMTHCTNLSEVRDALNKTFEMTSIIREHDFPALAIHDISSELHRARLDNSFLFADELLRVAFTLGGLKLIKRHIVKYRDFTPSLMELVLAIYDFDQIENTILKAIDNRANIVDSASVELKTIRSSIRSKKKHIETRLRAILRHTDYTHVIQDHIVTVRDDRYVIPIKRDHKGKLKGIVTDTSSSGETLFIEPEQVVEDNNYLIALFREEKAEEINILKALTKGIRDNLMGINESLANISVIDLIYSKAKLAIQMNAILPDVNDRGYFKLYMARHPLLHGDVIPVDLFLGEAYDILIITGPNTGGKTVALKTLGLLTMMAINGLLIPVNEGSSISVVDNIFIDSGDEQSIEQSLSTFSGHIKQIVDILANTTKDSLVLIDELGAGTDPDEGSALGIALLDEFRSIGSKAVITTHYAKIKGYPLFNNRVENACCEFDIKALKPIYRLIYGMSGGSNALSIAKTLGIKTNIINLAKGILKKTHTKTDELISNISEEKDRVAKLTESYANKFSTLSRKEAELTVREDLIKKEIAEIKRLKLTDNINTITDIRKKVLALYKEIRSVEPTEKVLKDGLKDIEGFALSTKEMLKEVEVKKPYINTDHEWKVGESAYIDSLNKTGKVYNISKSSVTVQVGDIKVSTSLDDLRVPVDTPLEDEPSASYELPKETIPIELNLIGLRGDEAIRKAELYIDRLYSSAMLKGRIVHGKGSGILRSLVEQLLKAHPHIESYNLARPEAGGYGVTEFFIK